MPQNPFQDALKAGTKPIQTWMWNPSVLFAEIISRSGFDSVGLDLQHGAIDFSDLYAMMAIISANGVTPMVRVPSNDRGWISRVLDGGAYGVICPDIQTPDEAASFASACKYAPQGTRGFGPVRTVIGSSGATEMAPSGYAPSSENDSVLCIVQIESPLGLQHAEEIINTPGVDAIFPGLMDYSILVHGEVVSDASDSRLRDPLEQIIEIAHAAGKPVGMPAVTPKDAPLLIEMGVDYLVMGNDVGWVTAGARETLEIGRRATSSS